MEFYCNGNSLAFIKRSSQKLLLTMKLTFFLLWAICLQVSAAVEAQTVTYSSRKVSLEKVFNEIAKQTGYQVLYNSYMVKDMGKVSVDFNHTPVKQAMNWALEGKPLAYSIVGNVIVIREKETTAESSVVPDLSEIHGTVVDSTTGRPLPGVTIRQQGGASGTTTDANGRFTINVPDDATLEITYLGYSRQVVHVNGRKELHVTLAEISTGLNQIVVVGYGTQRKRDLTSSIASIDSRDLRQVKTVSFTSAIEGKVPGVLISQTGGAPGSVASVRIRGVSTTGNNQPLYVVDGIPIDMGGMGVPGSSYSIDGTSIINPNDIASIEVLKDASASAIYGSRGANGVILITTKKGKEGKTHIELNASTGFSQPWRIPSFLNARQFATMANEIYTNSGLTPNPEWADPGSLGKGTDMLDLIFRDAPRQNYDLSISGGNSKLTSRLSLGYSQQDGIIIETSYKRYNAKEAIDFKPNEKIHIGGSVAFAATHSKGQNTDAMQGGILNLAEQFFPTLSPDSAFYGDALYYTKDGDNPILRAKTIDNELYNYRLFGNVFAAYTILPGLKFETNIGVDASFNRTSAWQGQIHRGFYNHAQATLAEVFNNSLMWDIENTLSYSKYFGLSNVSVVLGQSGNEYTDHYVGATLNIYLY
jgi:TonB-linked SusC/RagA family outer membrane protein